MSKLYQDLITQVKSYWTETVTQYPQVVAALRAVAESNLNMLEYQRLFQKSIAIKANDWKYKLPWLPLLMLGKPGVFNKYGDKDLTYSENGIVYGSKVTNPTSFLYVIDLPKSVLNCSLVMTSPLAPEVTFVLGDNLEISGNSLRIYFPYDVFESDLAIELEDSDEKLVVLWAKNCEVINESLFSLNEIALGINTDRSSYYDGLLLEGAYQSYAAGTSESSFFKVLSGILEVPIALESDEVVAITDKNIVTNNIKYSFEDLTPSVSVGDKFITGKSLVSEVGIFRGKNIADIGDLDLTRIPGEPTTYDVNVTNIPALPYIVGTDSDGFTIVGLASTGVKKDQYWTKLHEKGKLTGKTLCSLLYGTLTVSPSYIVKPVNSLKFIVDNTHQRDIAVVIDSTKVDVARYNRYSYVLEQILMPATEIIVKVL